MQNKNVETIVEWVSTIIVHTFDYALACTFMWVLLEAFHQTTALHIIMAGGGAKLIMAGLESGTDEVL
jgi:hypothetical protein